MVVHSSTLLDIYTTCSLLLFVNHNDSQKCLMGHRFVNTTDAQVVPHATVHRTPGPQPTIHDATLFPAPAQMCSREVFP
eukprot:1158482-Prorocentrum_minimum.AAC.3